MEGRPDLVVDAEPSEKKWSFYSGSQNLASALNDPMVPRPDIFTKDWGANFFDMPPMINLYTPPIRDWSLLDSYRKRIRRREQRIEQSRKLSQISLKGTFNSSIDHTVLISPSQEAIQEIVPRIFLRPDFSLEDENTFNAVISSHFISPSSPSSPTSSSSPSSHILSPPISSSIRGQHHVNSMSGARKTSNNHYSSPPLPPMSSELLKESIKNISKNLTDYLDMVEDNLSRQISKRFREFFHIMNAIDLVMDNLSKTIKQVTLLRNKCQQLQATFVKPNLQNIKLHRTRQNAMQVVEKMQLMSTISQTQPTIQAMLSNSDFAGSIDLISTTQEVFNTELHGLNCFRHLHSQLSEIRDIISKMMKEEFIKFIDAFCNKPLTDDQVSELRSIPQSERLESLVMGMLKNGCYSFIDDFNKEAKMAIKALIKQTVIETLSQDDDIEFSGKDLNSLFEKVKNNHWLRLLNLIFGNLNLLLRKMELIQRLMKKVVQEACEHHSNSNSVDHESNSNRLNNSENHQFESLSTNDVSPAGGDDISSSECSNTLISSVDCNQIIQNREYNKLMITINESLVAICEDAQKPCRDLIKCKAKSLDQSSIVEFLELSRAIESFTNECEKRCSRRVFTLESVLRDQANRFATRFHDEKKRKINSVLLIEQWKSLDPVPAYLQEMVDKFVHKNLSTINYASLRKGSDSSVSSPQRSHDNAGSTNDKPKGYVVFDGESFVVVSSMQSLISTILEYCRCCNEIPSLSMELLTRLIDLLLHFNIRTNHLVLGGEATIKANLKNRAITTRNLFLCCRSLQLVVTLLPCLESYFCDLLPSKNRIVAELFADVKLRYCEHIKKIPEKVISMVREFLTREMAKWEARPPVPSQPFQTVSQHFMRLHENILDVVPDADLSEFFIKLNELFKETLRKQLQRLKIQNDGGPQHGLVIYISFDFSWSMTYSFILL